MKKTNKDLPDSEIMQNILDALGKTYQELAKELGYSSHVTIWNILKGNNGISKALENHLIEKYDTLSALYIRKGKGQPLRSGAAVVERDMFGNYNDTPPGNFDTDELRLRMAQMEKDILETKMMVKQILEYVKGDK